jgi:hypothetical protein
LGANQEHVIADRSTDLNQRKESNSNLKIILHRQSRASVSCPDHPTFEIQDAQRAERKWLITQGQYRFSSQKTRNQNDENERSTSQTIVPWYKQEQNKTHFEMANRMFPFFDGMCDDENNDYVKVVKWFSPCVFHHVILL